MRLTEPTECTSAEERLRDAFATGASFEGEVRLGTQGGRTMAKVYWHGEAGVWGCLDEKSDQTKGRFWNAFGTTDPSDAPGRSLSITCEINPARNGIDRRVAGIFARDSDSGARFLLHTGRIGGGRAGIGPAAFREHYRGDTATLAGEGARTFSVVANLDDQDVVTRVSAFVKAIERVKAAVKSSPTVPLSKYWWANHGPAWKEARDSGYLWTPRTGTSGQASPARPGAIRAGDIVFHYAAGSLQAVSRCLGAGRPALGPARRGTAGAEGTATPMVYADIAPEVKLAEIEIGPAGIAGGPFDRNGDVKRGTLFPIPTEFVEYLLETFKDRIPALDIDSTRAQARGPSDPVASSSIGLGRLQALTHLDVTELNDLIGALSDRRQLILEGPPGSGKTYVADLVARHLSGNPLIGPADHRFQAVQFHQSYGYEDFMQGIRPETNETGQLEYRVRDGVFKRFCDQAREEEASEKPFVFLIDEINRGNISRIFGELLFLLEYRDRSLLLPFGAEEERFRIPSNVYVIGTMNTTDRSLAQIDYALRRRFYFYQLMPIKDDGAPVYHRWCESQEAFSPGDRDRLVRLFVSLNRVITEHLGENYQVGHSYFMRPDANTDTGLARIERRAIIPLLEEYFHNRRDRADLLTRFSFTSLSNNMEQPDP